MPEISAWEPQDEAEVDQLLDRSFGLSRRTKTSYRLREGSARLPGLSCVVREADFGLVGAISYWPLRVGKAGTPALLLGPLAVHPERQNRGIGLALMQSTLALAREAGHKLVFLVGDAPYYARVGFLPVSAELIEVPGPYDPKRLLCLELEDGAMEGVSGLILPPHRFLHLHH